MSLICVVLGMCVRLGACVSLMKFRQDLEELVNTSGSLKLRVRQNNEKYVMCEIFFPTMSTPKL